MIRSALSSTRPRLGDLAVGRENNLNLVRAAAAIGVLVSHAWPISLGPGTTEPLKVLTGFSLGTLCVMLFFFVSGFLIAGSWVRRPDIARFLAARALRLFPGLIVSLLLVALVMGPLVTSVPIRTYLASFELWSFLLQNSMLIWPQFTLPGVFEANPYPTVEGSIWTLIHEVLCYVGVLGAGVLGLLAPRRLPIALAVYGLLWFGLIPFDLPARLDAFHALTMPFAVGVLFFALKDRLVLSGGAALIGGMCALTLIQFDPAEAGGPLSNVVLSLAIGYATFWFAYRPTGIIRAFNQVGDYSYGLYIYAFPVQGFVIWAFGPMSPWSNIALALPLTLFPAILSWHFIESPALDLLKRRRSQCTA